MFFDDHFKFVCPSTGNDVTGTGTQEHPYKTMQKAVGEGSRRIWLGPGDSGNLNLNEDVDLIIMGCGDSQVGGVTTNGRHISVMDLGNFSFTCIHITTAGPTGASVPAGNALVKGVHFLDRVNTGGNFGPPGVGLPGNAAGSITAIGCKTQRFDANGNTGNNGSDSIRSGNGGAAGLITCIGCDIELGYDASGGSPGEDMGGGQGDTGPSPAPIMIGNVVAGAFAP